MFDRDGRGSIQVSLLPSETLWIPFTFMTLSPYIRQEHPMTSSRSRRTKDNESKVTKVESDGESAEPDRFVEVRIISGTHGHVVANLHLDVYHKPFIINRVFRFFEPDNTVMKRRIRLVSSSSVTMFPGEVVMSSKYVHCVENGPSNDCRVVIEWGPTGSGADATDPRGNGVMTGQSSLDIMMRYRCSNFPGSGDFFMLLYNDPYQIQLHEVSFFAFSNSFYLSN
jgi:hypothetical protein